MHTDLIDECRLIAEDIHCVSGTNPTSTALSLAADEITRLRAIEAAAVKVYDAPLWGNNDDFYGLLELLGKELRGEK